MLVSDAGLSCCHCHICAVLFMSYYCQFSIFLVVALLYVLMLCFAIAIAVAIIIIIS